MSNKTVVTSRGLKSIRSKAGIPGASVLTLLGAVLVTVIVAPCALAAEDNYSASNLRGDWIWSGMVKFAAPVPIPALHVQGAPPHTQVDPGQVVGLWGALLGRMRFDGQSHVTSEDVFKAGELQPLPPFPIPFLPPFPEIYEGVYSVSSAGDVEISLSGRDPNSPEGQVDYELDFHCLLNRHPAEMKCVISRFLTFAVDPNGYHAPITGIITFNRRR
jgi:hypothetical protein